MRSRTREAHRIEPDRAGKSILAGLSSLSAAALRWVRRTPPDREPAEPGGATQSALASLLSLSPAWWPWVRKTPRHGELKMAIVAALTHVDHYEDRDTRRPVDPDASGARAVGLSYREIQRRLQAKYPGGRVSIMTIRSYARDAKKEGWAMPYRRPNSRRRGKKAR